MKFGFALYATIVCGSGADAFTAGVGRSSRVGRVSPLREGIAEELDLPCEGDCSLGSYPNMPDSVHPGVVTGQAMVDLLDHAKDNGELYKQVSLEEKLCQLKCNKQTRCIFDHTIS